MARKEIFESLTIRVAPSTKREIDLISEKRGIPKSEVYRMMIDLGIDCHKDLDRLGIIPLMDFAQYVKTVVKNSAEKQAKGKQMQLP